MYKCVKVMLLCSTLVFICATWCNCDCFSKDKQRPTVHLKNAIEFYNTTIKLEEKVDSILLQLHGENNSYEKIFEKPMMELRTNLDSIVKKLENFKIQYKSKGEDFPLSEYNNFMESIDKKFQETSSLSSDIMPKFNQAIEKIDEDKNGLFKEISKFLTKRLLFEKNVAELDDFGIFLHTPPENEEEHFDLAVLDKLYQEKIREETVDNKDCNEDSYTNEKQMLALENTDHEQLRNFVPTVNKALERIEEKIELIGEKYDDILSRWLTTAEEVTSAEAKIMNIRQELKLNNNVYLVKNEL